MSFPFPLRSDDYEHTRLTRVKSLVGLLFGDRIGVVLFLTAVCFPPLFWRAGIFITDNITMVNLLASLADGYVSMERVVVGSQVSPGVYHRDGVLYGRNYGLAVSGLPFLWLLQGLDAVTNLRVALSGLWSLALLGAVTRTGHLLDRRRMAAYLGSALALLTFFGNLTVATTLSDVPLELLALQLSTLVAAGLLAVVTYRLASDAVSTRCGTLAGLAVVLATPVGFWATIPKRHVLQALLAMTAAYVLYRSHTTDSASNRLRYRAGAYAAGGLATWVHPPDGVILLVSLALVDLPTAKSNGLGDLAGVGVGLFVGLLPFFITNLLVTGNPGLPPRMLPGYNGGPIPSATPDPSGGDATGGSSTGGSTSAGPLATLGALVGTGMSLITRLSDKMIHQARTTVLVFTAHPERLYHTFVRGGFIEEVTARDGLRTINLSFAESMPLAAGVLSIPALAVTRIRSADQVRNWLTTPASKPDLFVATYAAVMVAMYMPRLPLHATVTVRYLVPMMPLLLYALFRIPAVNAAIERATPILGWSYTAGVLFGGQALLAAIAIMNLSLGEAVQLQALISLAMAVAVAAWAIVASAGEKSYPRTGALTLALAAASTTTFLLLSGWLYFGDVGPFVLPLADELAEAIDVL